MTIIKKIIQWIIALFKKLFGKKKITKKIKNNINGAKNKRYLKKAYGITNEDPSTVQLPIYLFIDYAEKKRLIDKTKSLALVFQQNNNIPSEVSLRQLEDVIHKIEESKISFYQKDKINEQLTLLLSDKDIVKDIDKKMNHLHTEIFEIIDNFEKNISDKVAKEYEKVNYITISNILLDETIEELKKLEDNYKKHKYNRYYYEREVNKVKERIKSLKKIRDSVKVREEIDKLRNDLYTKSKDKYDLLYNDEIFAYINKTCDDLVYKINRKVIDLKKVTRDEVQREKDKEKIHEEKEDPKKERLENIIKCFQDLELARKILLLYDKEEKIANADELFLKLSQAYYDFINGENVVFHFQRNKTKTELVKLYNQMNMLCSCFTKKEFVFIDHIHYRMDDLLSATMSKKEELENLLANKYNYQKEKCEESILVDNKLDLIMEEELAREYGNSSIGVKKISNKPYVKEKK